MVAIIQKSGKNKTLQRIPFNMWRRGFMNEWDGSGDHAAAKVTLEYIENLEKIAHAKVLEKTLS